TPVTITATVGKDTTFEATGNGVSCTTSPCIVTSSDVDPAINANLNSTAVYYPPTDAGTTTSTTNTGTSTNINSNTNTSSSSNMTGVGTNTTTNQSTSTNTDTNTLSNTNTSTTTSTPITSTSKKPILALPKTTTVLPSLKIKTTADLNAFIKNVTFFKSTVKNNFITNANVIIKKGQTLNLYFSNIKNTKSLGLYKKAGIAQNTVFGYPMNTVNMYLEDNATASGDNCSRSVLAQSPSIAPRSVVNPTPPTPLLNSMGGICDVLSIGSCLTNTYHLPIPSGWSLPYISPTGLSSNTDASSSSNTYWNNSFLENLIGNSGLLDITDGIDTEQDIDVYNGYMNALSNGGSPLQVSRTDFGGTKSSPSPISSDEQDQLYFLLNHTSNPINPIYSGVDCELESNDHASHINSISFGTDGQLHIGIDNDLAQGSIAPTGYSNIPAPSLQSGTEFTLNNEGRVVGVSGADAEGYWAQSSTYDWFIIHCYTLTSSSSSSTQQTSSTATASTNPGNSTTPNTQNTNSESTDPGLQTQDSSPVTIGSVDPALSTELKTNSTLNTFTNKITFFSSTTKANFLSNANYTIKNGQALDLYFSNTKDKDSIGLNKTTNKYLEDEAVAAGNTCSTLIPALSRWDTKTITLQTPLLNNAKKGICSILATAESIVYTLGLPTPSGWVDPIYTATSTNITVWNTVFWEQMARASGLAPRSKWSYR
ncbi:MAG: hypothetical protein WCO09_02435, partial [bacterium]